MVNTFYHRRQGQADLHELEANPVYNQISQDYLVRPCFKNEKKNKVVRIMKLKRRTIGNGEGRYE